MRRKRFIAIAAYLLTIALGFCGFAGPTMDSASAQSSSETYAIRNARIITVTGPVIENGTVVIANGKISAVGASIPVPAGAKIIDAKGLSVYPGMIDADTEIGLTEIGSVA